MVYGLLPSGFNPKTSDVIVDELATEQSSAIGPLWNARTLSLVGVVNTSVASQLAAVWEALAQIHKQFDRRDAEGEALDSCGALVGTLRRPRRRTVVIAQCLMIPGTTITAGQMIAHVAGDANRRFKNSFGFTVPGVGIVGVNVNVQFESIEYGAIACPATYLTFMDVVIAGWIGVNNLADGVLGDNVESDEAYRVRQESELASAGSATQPALISALARVSGVSSVAVLNNDTDATVDTIPPHSVECVVEGGADVDLAATIFREKAPGDGTSGTSTGNVAAEDGLTHAIRWTRPVAVAIHLRLDVQVTSEYPGDAALKSYVVNWANGAHAPGADVVPSRIGAKCFEVPGVWNVVNAWAGTSPLTSAAVVPIGTRQRAAFDVVRVTVNVIP